jgi:hypothetical protein
MLLLVTVIRGCNNTRDTTTNRDTKTEPSRVWSFSKCSPYRIFSQINPRTQSPLNILSTTPTMMMLRPIAVVSLLLTAVRTNAELLRGASLEHTEERNLGTCLCTIICQQCELQGVDNSQCQTACAYSEQPNCDKLCDDFVHGVGNRDDSYTSPPLPAEPPTPTPTCRCVTLCEQCKAVGSDRKDCKTVCEFAALSNAECTTQCNEALHIDEYYP